MEIPWIEVCGARGKEAILRDQVGRVGDSGCGENCDSSFKCQVGVRFPRNFFPDSPPSRFVHLLVYSQMPILGITALYNVLHVELHEFENSESKMLKIQNV